MTQIRTIDAAIAAIETFFAEFGATQGSILPCRDTDSHHDSIFHFLTTDDADLVASFEKAAETWIFGLDVKSDLIAWTGSEIEICSLFADPE